MRTHTVKFVYEKIRLYIFYTEWPETSTQHIALSLKFRYKVCP